MSEITKPEPIEEIIPVEIGKEKKSEPTTKKKKSFGTIIIFKKTFLELFSFKRVLPYLLLSLIFPIIFSSVVVDNIGQISTFNIDYQISTIVNYFIFYSFFWNSGILLMVFCGLTASTFISNEETQGTMIFLLTKPIRRSTIFFGKYFGYLLNMSILQLMSLLLNLTATCSIFGVSSRVFLYGMYYFIPVFIYSIIMIAAVGLILGFLSIINKRIVVSVLVTMLLVILTYFVGIIFRLAIPEYYEQWMLYLFDIGYNLSLIFTLILGIFGFQPSPTFQTNMGLFFGTYPSIFGDAAEYLSSIDAENGLTFILPETGHLNPIVSIIGFAIITVVLTILGIILLERKDISP